MNKQNKQQERWYRAQAMTLHKPYDFVDEYFVVFADDKEESDRIAMEKTFRWIENGYYYHDIGRCNMELMEVVEVDHDHDYIPLRTIYE